MAARMHALFAGHGRAHGTHGQPDSVPGSPKWEIKRTARTIHAPATVELWAEHLAGRRPLGVIPIREDSTCSWGSVDVDDYDANPLRTIERVEAAGLPLVPCRSKSGGLHLFVFLTEPRPAREVRAALAEFAAHLGLAGSEIFPKQTQVLTEQGDVGNWIVAPYYGDDFGGRLRAQVGLKKTGAEQTVEEFLRAAEGARLTPEQFAALAAPRPRPASSSSSSSDAGAGPGGTKPRKENGAAWRGALPPDGPFSDGPPCLQHLAVQGFPEGGRNKALLMIGVYLKKSRTDWAAALEEANRAHMRPPLPTEEVMSVVRSLERKDYFYTCREEPMASHCDSVRCCGRRFGVGDGSLAPRISGLSKLDVDPPVWFADVDDARIECTTDDLQNYVRFHKLCMERLNRCFVAMRQADWLGLVSEAMRGVTLIEAPPDAGAPGRFREHLEEFLTNRARGHARSDLLGGLPWEDEDAGRHYFRLRDLQKFLEREGVRDVSRGQLVRRIQKLGGGSQFFNENLQGKQRGVACWWVPSTAVDDAGAELPVPGRKGSVI